MEGVKTHSQSIRKILSVGIVLLVPAALALTVFQHWEMTHETWQYWFFARVLAETGRFVIPDRSPLYVVYLELFRWLGYPRMVTAEYVVTGIISSFVIVQFLRRYMPLPAVLLGIILALPYFQISEPSVQKLALSACLGAVMLRRGKGRFGKALSYGLLIAAFLLRSNFGAVLGIFIVWDCAILLIRKTYRTKHIALSYDWPVLLAGVFYVVVLLFQSPHPWNNVWGATTTWFPSDGKSFIRMLQNYNASYIMLHYGRYQDHDFYFTNQEVFPGAHDLLTAYRVNPAFMQTVLVEYTKFGIPMVNNLTRLPAILRLSDNQLLWHTLLLALVFISAYLSVKDADARLYVLASIIILGSTIFHMPKERYMVFMVPVFYLSAAWCGNSMTRVISGLIRKKELNTVLRPVQTVITAIFLFYYSSGPSAINFSGVFQATWPNLIKTAVNDYRSGNLRALDIRDTSVYFPPLKSSYATLSEKAMPCTGILTQEHTFFGAFMQFNYQKIHDIWEIPPFGSLNDPGAPYRELTPERINCLFISKNLKYGVGAATNSQIRYENYIEPYARYLISRGAKTYPIEGYGEAIIL